MWVDFAQVAVFIVVSLAFFAFNMFLSRLVRPHNPGGQKATSYECGEQALGDSFIQFNTRFYLIALDFLIFDVEIVLLFPWAVSLKQTGWAGFWAFALFFAILALGLAWVWIKGGLEWVKSVARALPASSTPLDGTGGPRTRLHSLEPAIEAASPAE
ncbi:MAG: NADH-quinone oxidoreductase subunit A [Candidatus Latescibacteria bacterium]|jgi:NADH-quinone oxidoreductase subunit A|nr:NADH-quinone oxidoreductase subunit A [Candidatus Latescibacterota bacterium]